MSVLVSRNVVLNELSYRLIFSTRAAEKCVILLAFANNLGNFVTGSNCKATENGPNGSR